MNFCGWKVYYRIGLLDRKLVREILGQMIFDGNILEKSKGFQFRCIKCGDSKKSKYKKRGWVIFRGDLATYMCFNCNCKPQSFKNFVKEYEPQLFDTYFKNRNVKNILTKNNGSGAELLTSFTKEYKNVKDVSEDILPSSFKLMQRNVKGILKKELQREAIEMVKRRKIPKEFYKDFLVCYGYVNDDLTGFKNRLIIPFYDKNKKMYCFQGRTLGDSMPKYLTWNDDNIKIFNFYHVDPKKPVWIFEGPVDAMFIPNSIATCGQISPDSEQFKLIKKRFPNRIWAFDNQQCDVTGRQRSISFAEHNEKIFIWPKKWSVEKDMNEIILNKKLTSEKICSIMFDCVYKGKSAILNLKTG